MSEERIVPVTMPKWGLSMTSGKIMELLVSEGQQVSKGDDFVEIDTDKILGTMEAPADGLVRKLVVRVGEEIPVGAVIAVLAPADVPDEEVGQVAAEARDAIDSGAVVVEDTAEPQTVEVGGRRISYLTLAPAEPAGDPVVLVHGYGGDKNSFALIQQPLAESRTVHALDLPGHGESAKEVGDGSVQLLADTVVGFLDALGIARAHLVGHSLGGAVVAAVARAAPSRAGSLTLLAPAGFGTEANAEYLRGFASASSRRELKPLVAQLFADESLMTRQFVDDLLKYKRLDGVADALAAFVSTLLDDDGSQAIDTAAALDGVQVPVTVLWGAADRILPPPADLPWPVTTVQCGHLPHLEAPGEVVRLVSSAG